MLRILVTVEEETGYKDLIRMKQVTVVLSDDVLAQIASHVASQQNMHLTGGDSPATKPFITPSTGSGIEYLKRQPTSK